MTAPIHPASVAWHIVYHCLRQFDTRPRESVKKICGPTKRLQRFRDGIVLRRAGAHPRDADAYVQKGAFAFTSTRTLL
jgi:hypothetical protein